MTIPDIAIGAIFAAIIGALISLVGLIVTKEAKISEFRQGWIDSLRSELSSFMSNVNAVMDTRGLTFDDNNKRFDMVQPYTSKLNEAYYMVAFRLNAGEDASKKLKACMVRILKMVATAGPLDVNAFEQSRIDFINGSNKLLKDEWKRVKRGEPVYRVTRWIAAIAVVVLLVIGAAAVLSRKPVPEPQKIGSAASEETANKNDQKHKLTRAKRIDDSGNTADLIATRQPVKK